MGKGKTVPLIEKGSGEFCVEDQTGRGKELVPVGKNLIKPEMTLSFVEIHLDLIDELDIHDEREITMRMLRIPPYIDGPATFRGIAGEMEMSRYAVKKLFYSAMKKIRRRVYEEAKIIVNDRRSRNK